MRTEFMIWNKAMVHTVIVYADPTAQESEMYAQGPYVVVATEQKGVGAVTLMLKKSEARALASAIMGAAADL